MEFKQDESISTNYSQYDEELALEESLIKISKNNIRPKAKTLQVLKNLFRLKEKIQFNFL
jgi:hypothetical protein